MERWWPVISPSPLCRSAGSQARCSFVGPELNTLHSKTDLRPVSWEIFCSRALLVSMFGTESPAGQPGSDSLISRWEIRQKNLISGQPQLGVPGPSPTVILVRWKTKNTLRHCDWPGGGDTRWPDGTWASWHSCSCSPAAAVRARMPPSCPPPVPGSCLPVAVTRLNK